MKKLDLTKICDIEVDNIKMYDAFDFVDAYISSAWYKTGKNKFRELNEKELDYLNNNEREFVYEEVIKSIY